VACGDEVDDVLVSGGLPRDQALESREPSTGHAFSRSQVGRVRGAGGSRWASPSSL